MVFCKLSFIEDNSVTLVEGSVCAIFLPHKFSSLQPLSTRSLCQPDRSSRTFLLHHWTVLKKGEVVSDNVSSP